MLCIIVIAVIYVLSRFFEMKIRKKPDGSAFVVDALWSNKWYYYIYFCGVHLICVFSIPFVMLVFFWVRLIATLRSAVRQQIGRHGGGKEVDPSMLVILIAVFLFCHGLFWVYNSRGFIFGTGFPVTPCINIKSLYLRVFLHIVLISNSSVNFFIYLVYLREFRRKLCPK